jgi:hypothetical protein
MRNLERRFLWDYASPELGEFSLEDSSFVGVLCFDLNKISLWRKRGTKAEGFWTALMKLFGLLLSNRTFIHKLSQNITDPCKSHRIFD